MVTYPDIFHISIKNIHFCFTVVLLGSAQSYCPLLTAKVILASEQDFELILALSTTKTYGLIFILSYATSVLCNTYFPVNLMRQCLFFNFT